LTNGRGLGEGYDLGTLADCIARSMIYRHDNVVCLCPSICPWCCVYCG